LPNVLRRLRRAHLSPHLSKVVTRTDQASLRLDHRLSGKSTLFLRASRNQVTGPTTNPDQTAIDPDFGVKFFDHQRNFAVRYPAPLPAFQFFSNGSRFYSQYTSVYHRQTKASLPCFRRRSISRFQFRGWIIFGSYGKRF